jgi:protein-L-isoaspartate(D-aspartate) O-methyltransferase
MTDFAAARRRMVDGQIRTADVTDQRLVGAFLELPRERFLPPGKVSLAYLDRDIALTEPNASARCLLKPMVLAKLLQAAEVSETDHVLDVGCGSGYSTALLSQLAQSIVGLEQDEVLAQQARAHLSQLGCRNAKIIIGALARGCPVEAPYDLIVMQGATEIVPKALATELKEGGRLVCVVGSAPSAKAMLFRKVAKEASGRVIFDAAAPLLPGFAKPPAFVF